MYYSDFGFRKEIIEYIMREKKVFLFLINKINSEKNYNLKYIYSDYRLMIIWF